MNAALKVLTPGLHTTVQDLGRVGYQALGVPVSGALDDFSLRLGNALVGNPPGTAALEILHSGPSFEVAADTVRVAVAGVGAALAIEGERGRIVAAWHSASLVRGEVFQIVLGRESVCAYLAVEGGIAVPPVLGSASTYLRAGLGGFEGRSLRQGDLVPLAVERASERPEQRLPAPLPATAGQPIRVILGPQQEYFTEEAVATLLDAEFRISTSADRMGMRLDGPRLCHRHGWDIVSDAIATGAIQVPGSGQPILLLADAHADPQSLLDGHQLARVAAVPAQELVDHALGLQLAAARCTRSCRSRGAATARPRAWRPRRRRRPRRRVPQQHG